MQRALRFQAAPCAFETAAFGGVQAGLVVVFEAFAALGAFQAAQLQADVQDVVEQALHAVGGDGAVGSGGGIVLQRRFGTAAGAFELGRQHEIAVVGQRAGKLAAGVGLQPEQALDAVD